MALSDPVNVRLGAERRKQTLMKLAQQMAARAGARGQGAGAMFRSNVQGRRMAQPSLRLPFPMPEGRTRPAGFDPNMGMPPVFESGPPSMGGGVGLGGVAPALAPQPEAPMAPAPTPEAPAASATVAPVVTAGGWTGAVDPASGIPLSAGMGGFGANGQWAGQSDTPLETSAPATYPSPYEIMMAAQIQRLMQSGGGGGRMRVM